MKYIIYNIFGIVSTVIFKYVVNMSLFCTITITAIIYKLTIS